jgi:hypothetical protein
VLVVVLENPDRFAIRLTEQINCRTSVSLRSSQCTEDEHDDEDEDDSKFRNLGSSAFAISSSLRLSRQPAQAQFDLEKARGWGDRLYYAQELIVVKLHSKPPVRNLPPIPVRPLATPIRRSMGFQGFSAEVSSSLMIVSFIKGKRGLRAAVQSRPSAATSASHSAWISCSMSAGLVTVRPISSRRIAAYCLRNR